MNKFKNKWIFIVAILVIIFGIVIYSNKADISELIGINSKDVFDNDKKIICDKSKNQGHNKNILGAYLYNDSVSKGENGYCTIGTESTCLTTDCINEGSIGACPAGTIIKYQVNDSTLQYFNVLHDDGSGIMTLQTTSSITASAWNSVVNTPLGPTTALDKIEEYTKSWTNVNELNYCLGIDCAPLLKYSNLSYTNSNYTSFNDVTSNSMDYGSYKYTSITRNGNARIISLQEAADVGCSEDDYSCPKWMYINYNGDIENYWTLTAHSSYNTVTWIVSGNYSDLNGKIIYTIGQRDCDGIQLCSNIILPLRAVVEINK